MSRNRKRNSHDNVEFGIVLILIGCAFLAHKLGYLSYNWHWWELIASAAAVLGTIRILRARNLHQFFSGAFQIGFGAAIYAMFEHLWGLNFYVHWPILLIGLGLSSLIKYAVRSKEDAEHCQ